MYTATEYLQFQQVDYIVSNTTQRKTTL